MDYNYSEIEKKWQERWEKKGAFKAQNGGEKEKFYVLVEFPYPSGTGLHVGHVRSYTALDSLARLKRSQGYNVLFPMGWDAFGAPAEQYAVKNHVYPASMVKDCISTFKSQIKSLGLSFDWTREFSTTDPEYYKWTQWQFLQFYKAGLAYKAEKEINWCPNCKTGLSNEDAAGGICERCGSPTTKKLKNQWMLKMSSYADSLIEGLKDTEFLDKIKTAQINWIGKSVGAEVDFKLKDTDDVLTVFTTRCDTLFGVTAMVLSPEHEYLTKYKDRISNYDEITKYQDLAKKKSEIERTDMTKDKTGVKVEGLTAINPVNDEPVEIWISDYVLSSYGTGAIMVVPAHDERDFAFAKKFNIPIKQVIKENEEAETQENLNEPLIADGIHVNSGFLDSLNKEDAIEKMLEFLEKKGFGRKKVNYRLQDWIFSRQRFWGEPIPMIYCEKCGWVPVPERDLPVILPDVPSYEPTDNGESPLSTVDEWVNVSCPKCGGAAKRETDTMPNWAGSSWYWIRYMDANCQDGIASMDAMKYWGQVDLYNGGMEHATRHLLYARFWNQFLYDQGIVPFREPFKKRVAHGMILNSNGKKFSKSAGDGVNPTDMVNKYSADALRTFEMFIGDYTKDAFWNEEGLKACKKFLDRIYRLQNKLNTNEEYSKDLESDIHKTIKKVTEDIETMNYNTAVSALMILLNNYDKQDSISRKDYRTMLHLLNPIAPHITEEINEICKLGAEFTESEWPTYDESKMVTESYEIGVQVNGKLRASISVGADETEDSIKQKAFANENIIKHTEGREVIKTIVIPKRIVSIVVK